MDPATVTAWAALGAVILGGGGVGGYWLAHRRLNAVEVPTAQATATKAAAEAHQLIAVTDPTADRLRAETENLHAQARTSEVTGVINALERVSDLYSKGLVQISDLAADVATMRSSLGEVEDQVGQFRHAWSVARDMLSTHGKWDQRAAPVLRTIEPDFPDPPPLELAAEGDPDGPPPRTSRTNPPTTPVVR